MITGVGWEAAQGRGNRLGKSKEISEEHKSIWFERSGPRHCDIREAGRMEHEALIIHTENLGYRPKAEGLHRLKGSRPRRSMHRLALLEHSPWLECEGWYYRPKVYVPPQIRNLKS